MRAHRIEADRVALLMQAASQTVIQRRAVNRDRRVLVNFSDTAQRFDQNFLLCFELMIEPQRRPIASAALLGDGTRRRAAKRTRLDDAHQLRARKSFFHFRQAHDRDVAGENVRGEDRKTVDARERGAAGDELRRRNRDLIADSHVDIVSPQRGRRARRTSSLFSLFVVKRLLLLLLLAACTFLATAFSRFSARCTSRK
ncbi:MAG TPA: hypothetical protein VI258_03080 [Rhodanobacteraceae bacterium]